ncbi:MAG: response regulator [Bdellovibrionales bacterium]
MKILLAEDDPNIAKIAIMTLEKLGGHEVIHASNGEEALDLAINHDVDLLLLDEMMPKKNGLTVCQEYQSTVAQPKPVIFLSAKSQMEDLDAFLTYGIGHIAKPFDPASLVQRINQLLENADQ